MVKHYVEFAICKKNSKISEYQVEEIKERKKITLNNAPKDTFGYRFFDVPDTSAKYNNGQPIESERINYTNWNYWGKIYTFDEVVHMGDKYTIIAIFMRNNHVNKAVKTIRGNWEMLYEGQTVETFYPVGGPYITHISESTYM